MKKRTAHRMPANQLLSDIDCGVATAELIPLVYNELRRLAAHYLRRESSGITLQPTTLVHEAYVELTTFNKTPWQNRAQFHLRWRDYEVDSRSFEPALGP